MDHIARADALRRKAAAVLTRADHAKSHSFKICFELLAVNYELQARLEEDYAAGSQRLGQPATNVQRPFRGPAERG
jgi:hypothetical protein